MEAQGFSKENAEGMVKALQENQELVTKTDLKESVSTLRSEMKDMEIRLLGAINAQTWKFIGSIGLIAVLFKLAEMIIK